MLLRHVSLCDSSYEPKYVEVRNIRNKVKRYNQIFMMLHKAQGAYMYSNSARKNCRPIGNWQNDR